MSEIFTDVLPVFLLILVGWVIVRTGLLKAEVGEAMSEFVFKIAVPLLLFQTIAEANFRGASPFRLLRHRRRKPAPGHQRSARPDPKHKPGNFP